MPANLLNNTDEIEFSRNHCALLDGRLSDNCSLASSCTANKPKSHTWKTVLKVSA